MKSSNGPTSNFVPDSLIGEVTSAIQWWRDAGLDADFQDTVTTWLNHDQQARLQPDGSMSVGMTVPTHQGEASEVARVSTRKSSTFQKKDFFEQHKPRDLSEFREFWLNAPILDNIGSIGRVAPRGPSHPDVMVLVFDPEESDRDDLLSGPQGDLLKAMLTAMNVGDESVYVASALPRHTPLADTSRLASEGLDAVLLHHIELVKPKHLLGFGGGLAPFLEQITNKTADDLRKINHVSSISKVLLSDGLDTLMDMPRLKARFWRRWIEWSAQRS